MHALVVTFVLVAASSSVAQQTPREPAGPPGAVPEPLPLAILDVRGASVGLPTGIGWTPAVPVGAQIPGRGIGFDVGAHLYPLRTKLVAIGLGGTVLVGRGRTSPPDTSGTATSTLTPLPGVRTTLTGLVPQVSFNFGHRLGWSYLSGGIGRTRVSSEVTGTTTGSLVRNVESAWARTLNYGGGARWFVNDHMAFSLEIRWFKVSPVAATGTSPALPRQSLITAGAGVSFK